MPGLHAGICEDLNGVCSCHAPAVSAPAVSAQALCSPPFLPRRLLLREVLRPVDAAKALVCLETHRAHARPLQP